jgi:TPR repeat protein
MRFEQRGDPRDMNEAIDFYREALALCSPSHPTRYRSLSNLGNALQKRFEKSGDPADIEEAIKLGREAVLPPDLPNRDMCLNNLAIAVQTRFERWGNWQTLMRPLNLADRR